jgi:hypothetical protein
MFVDGFFNADNMALYGMTEAELQEEYMQDFDPQSFINNNA